MTISEVPAPSGGTDLRDRVAAEVRAWMARRRVNVPRLATQTGLSPAYLYRRLSGETAFDVDDLGRLATALGVSVISLFPAQEREEGITLNYSATPGASGDVSGMSPTSPVYAESPQVRRAA